MIQSRDCPKHFYKYKYIDEGKPDYSRRIFTHNELHFSNPSIFNDPFDCNFELGWEGSCIDQFKHWQAVLKREEPFLNRKERLVKARQLVKANKPGVRESIEEKANLVVRAYGICCLSKARDTLRMWECYANTHRGFCLEFSNERSDDPFGVEPRRDGEYQNPEILVPHPVRYSDNSTAVNPIKDKGPTLVKKTVLTKTMKWEYEEEWRMVNPNGEGPHQFPSRFLTGVIFGCRMLENHKKMIRDWCKDRETTVQYYEARLSDDSYSLTIVPAP